MQNILEESQRNVQFDSDIVGKVSLDKYLNCTESEATTTLLMDLKLQSSIFLIIANQLEHYHYWKPYEESLKLRRTS
ncbi:uncharacterized protein J8A68_002167 [[Candida] subhashii]|uniref:Uncharacterized protein n=1 Tax=[Candida] subhashii TaxID=561895 RepID=A0A8J5V1D1_9ASCO|nr:uncharacterized protein J8A68_002167 [[Candida] subhashii]KAG7664309.1 hypothetical protein J8A68_002167 [[Candida] subhashii]